MLCVLKWLDARFCKPSASFMVHIFRIVLKRTNKKVVRICAFRIVTFMKNIHSTWNYTKMNFPRCAMGCNFFMWLNSALDHPITKRMFGSIPFPTSISFFHFQPKAKFQRSMRFRFYGHKNIVPISLGECNG